VVGAGGGVIYSTNSLQHQLEAYELQVSDLTYEVNTQTSTISSLVHESINLETEITSLENDVSAAYATAYYYENLYVELLADYQSLQTQQSTTESGCEYEAFILVNQEYYHDILDEMRNAESSIIIAMYSMKYDPGDSLDWANDLIEELVYAKNRGVNVTVILEYQTFFGFQDENLDTYDFLTTNGVDVLLDYEDDTDHQKSVIIDYSIFYIGSHNWSESGLYYNNEVSVKLIYTP
jgi:phosphatidylserine/phosphatidylglycerophosphate/cardiolipin synthase-like enzyme